MSRIYMISTQELHYAIEILQDLRALADSSEYLETEVEVVVEMLRSLDSISTESYLLLNKLKEC